MEHFLRGFEKRAWGPTVTAKLDPTQWRELHGTMNDALKSFKDTKKAKNLLIPALLIGGGLASGAGIGAYLGKRLSNKIEKVIPPNEINNTSTANTRNGDNK